MSQVKRLSELFKVNAQFCRSANIITDYEDPKSLSSYMVTPLGRDTLRRLGEGLGPGSHNRAWSIIGPYGSGKSSWALFMSRFLGYPVDKGVRQSLRELDPDLYEDLSSHLPDLVNGGFLIVPVVGSREPLSLALCRGLSKALAFSPFAKGTIGEIIGQLDALGDQIRHGEPVGTTALTDVVAQLSQLLTAGEEKCLGLILVIDELGKLLEYAALNPSRGDIFLLQSLSETAARSGANAIGLVTILHQAFDHYAASLGSVQQKEWAKVQGRFEEIPFLEPPSEVLKLISAAIERTSPFNCLKEVVDAQAAGAKDPDICPAELDQRDIEAVLARCAPLHPTVALVLGRLFRSRLAQNDRSLFAFLSSGEPHGFREYLDEESWSGDGYLPFYRLDRLYDYVLDNIGRVLYGQLEGKRWAEIEDSLDRLARDAAPLDARLIKTIGMLGLLGDQRYLKASTEVLTYALADGKHTRAGDVQDALKRLEQRRIAIYRRHRDAYGLWEGSDIDLDEQLQKARSRDDRVSDLATLLQEHGQLRPYLAKRHLYQTGTLRYFVPWVVNLENFAEVLARPFAPADGAIVFVLSNEGKSATEIAEALVDVSAELAWPRRELLFFAVPQETAGIREALDDVLDWQWVGEKTPGLEDDRTARRELTGRQIDAQKRYNHLRTKFFDKASSYATSLWVWAGRQQHFQNGNELSAMLSEACDLAYPAAPIAANELVNRRALSSAAAAARRTLLERMVTRGHEPRLGIEGYPPELSMYRSLLEQSGIHRQAENRWWFGSPSVSDDPCHVLPLWEGMQNFLSQSGTDRRLVSDLFAMLREPPYGLKDGLLPIYFTAALLHGESAIALYENGSFIPNVDTPVLERLVKLPGQFSVQYYGLGEIGPEVFARYASLVSESTVPDARPSLLSAVRPLIAFARRLPTYTCLTTKLSPEATCVREALLKAREPHRLLCEDLPAAFRLEPLTAATEPWTIEAFFADLKGVLEELEGAYGQLLTMIQEQLFSTLRSPQDFAETRKEIVQRAEPVGSQVADLRLKAFALRLADSRLPAQEWLESVASLVANKPPKQWNDRDETGFEVALAELAGRFQRVEEVLLEKQRVGGEESAGLTTLFGVTAASGEEHRGIARVLPGEEAELDQVVKALETTIRNLGVSPRIGVAAVARLAELLLSGSNPMDDEIHRRGNLESQRRRSLTRDQLKLDI